MAAVVIGCRSSSTSPTEPEGVLDTKQRVALAIADSQHFEFLVETTSPHQLEPYLSQYFSEWPDRERPATPTMLEAAVQGADTPWASHVRTVNLGGSGVLAKHPNFAGHLTSGSARAFEALFEHATAWTSSASSEIFSHLLVCCGSNMRDAIVFAPSLSTTAIEALGNAPSLESLELIGLEHRCLPHPPDDLCIRTQVGHRVRQLVAQPWPRLHKLTLAAQKFGMAHQEYLILSRSQLMSQLSTLELRGLGIDDNSLKTIADAPNAENLRRLELTDTQGELSAIGFGSLSDSQHFTSLRELRISGYRLGDDALVALARGPLFAQWTSLDFSPEFQQKRASPGYELGQRGVRAIAKNGHNLRSLNLSGHTIDASTAGFLSVEAGDTLTELRLSHSGVTARGAVALSHGLRHLEHLSLAGNPIGDTGLKALAETGALDGLKHLDLSRTKVGKAGIKALVETDAHLVLEHLDISDNQLGDQGLGLLATKSWPSLRSIDISANAAQTLEGFFQAEMPALVEFHARANSLGGVAATHLADWESTHHLQRISFPQNPIGTTAGIARILTHESRRLTSLNAPRFVIDDELALRIAENCLASPNPRLYVSWQIAPRTRETLHETLCLPKSIRQDLADGFQP